MRHVATTIADQIVTLGPIGRHSSRPGLLTSALAASLYWFLPASWPVRALIVLLSAAVAQLSVCLTTLDPEAGTDRIVIDRWAGVWMTLVPLRENVFLLVAAVALYHLMESRQIGPVRWAAARAGGRRFVVDDIVAAALAAIPLIAVDRLLG